MKKTLPIAIAVSALLSLPATAAPVKMSDKSLDEVVAGGICPPPPPPPPETRLKGNNGWGNGADPDNSGSLSGGTAPSKSTNSSQPAFGKINTNPTMSDGR